MIEPRRFELAAEGIDNLTRREKRGAAIHEASHAVVLMYFGGPGRGRGPEERQRRPDGTSLAGRFTLYALPGEAQFPREYRQQMGFDADPLHRAGRLENLGWKGGPRR